MSRFQVGERVRVRAGIYDPDSWYAKFEGQVGTICAIVQWIGCAQVLFEKNSDPDRVVQFSCENIEAIK